MAAVRFVLNDQDVAPEAAPGDMLLDYLRLNRGLTGSKEGCAEGDCGACSVLVGRVDQGRMTYAPVNACIRPLATCHGQHIVTVEGLAVHGPAPVQQAMVDHHASQCGFCSPGIAVVLHALRQQNAAPSIHDIEVALQGNLCRCTGYGSIIAAAQAAGPADPLAGGNMVARLAAIAPADSPMIPVDEDALARAYAASPDATLVAGATDVGLWVTKQMRDIAPAIFIGHLMQGIEDRGDSLRLGAGVTYTRAAPALAALAPAVGPYLQRIGGWQVRNAGTVGGNIANGSPIGDMPPLLIALGTRIGLRRGDQRREIPLQDYFLTYGKQDRQPGEFLEYIDIPRPAPGDLVAAEKVSKRRDSDITAVAMGFWLRHEGGQITDARLAYGGLDGIPRRAQGAEAALIGQPFTAATFDAAARAAEGDFTPLTDMRASAEYRRMLAGNLIRRAWEGWQ
ncbi:MAG: xanthine dehydrogenase small subunit [Paracoccus sp. (in: a-proteobacteria)]|uniref:xanthine dehydrogenase small subunit n=1 Tax=Paracoccus sp. TaxID=267 RepID=UPI0026DF5609|nr:xanthine dehydrogenase small subunit [Paracoccus sp. (in: a-proteobacteria)]MDO5620246.1 xanthine dehydrogenase small subunit [Paracoccus sp. (in: a-proteobacteria)]